MHRFRPRMSHSLAVFPSFAVLPSLTALLALTGTLALTVPGQAQAPAPAPPSPPIAPPASPAPEPDLLPLAKAFKPLMRELMLQLQYDSQLTGSTQGISFTSRKQARIVAKRPGHFRVELTRLSADNTPQQRLLVVSNGVTVWTYRPGTRQYSATSFKAFKAKDSNTAALGLVIGIFFAGDGQRPAQDSPELTKDDGAETLTRMLTKMLNQMAETTVTLSSKVQRDNAEDDLVYSMPLPKQGVTCRFVVNSADNALRQMEFAGTDKGTQFAIKEQINQLAPLTTVAKDTFTFTPPPGTAKVAMVPIDTF